mgnify:CR=1 FL=1
MIKLLVKIFSILLVTAILIIIYFSLVGLKTEKFNEVITKQLLKNNSNIDVKLKDVNFMLSPLDLSINIDRKIKWTQHKIYVFQFYINI